MRCNHCPAGPGCPGESASRLCELVDPGHPDHDPRYGPLLAERAAAARGGSPALTTQAASLATSLWAWAVDGFRIADEAEQARRRAICAACPEWDAAPRRCRICGCHTDAKIALRSAHCPLPAPKW